MQIEQVSALIDAYKRDETSVYNTWFVACEARLKAFRSIRTGTGQVVRDIRAGDFPSDFKDSSLEFVLKAIAEQKQVFEGVAHPFYWKPKLRIPDIYENESNKAAFGEFLDVCLRAKTEDQIVDAVLRLDARRIKGLGPAVANILYFLHPTLMPPCNTAIIRGFNLLFNDRKQLGSWTSYLEMRDVIVSTNDRFRNELSKDLGAFAGLLFDIGVGTVLIAENLDLALDKEREAAEKRMRKRREEIASEAREEHEHAKIQHMLLRAGRALGYDVIAACNDRGKAHEGERFATISLPALPALTAAAPTRDTIDLIDVLWFERGTSRVACAFEVEKTTSIYSGILRLSDLAVTLPDDDTHLYLVAPDGREREVVLQLQRPAFAGNDIRYILFSDLCEHCDSMCLLGEDRSILGKLAKAV